MKVKEILDSKQFDIINDSTNISQNINKLFASDLMSHVMGFAESGDCLLTVLNNINVLGVASLLDFTCVIFTHGVSVNETIIKKANELDIPILSTKLTTVDAVLHLKEIGE